jgi:MoaA/NifB/PqqE/SkfB family radical SAM enzyme
MQNSHKEMSLSLFDRIVKKAKYEGYNIIGLYNWTEPFLNMNLPEFLSIIKKSGCTSLISSNMSFYGKFDLIGKSLSNTDILIISVSGYNQDVYEINHRGGRIDRVKTNLEYISKKPHNTVVLRFIKFDYNVQEEPLLREYAESMGIGFEVIRGDDHPSAPYPYSEQDYLNRLEEVKGTPKISEGICPLMMDTIGIDCQGDVYLCCNVPNYHSMRIGPYLNLSENDILIKRYIHPACRFCEMERREATVEDLQVIAAIRNAHSS